MGIPGVIKSDFYAVRELYTHEPGEGAQGSLQAQPLRYRYITEAYWPDRESFNAAFFDSGYQKQLMESLQRIADPLFLVSEEVLSAEN